MTELPGVDEILKAAVGRGDVPGVVAMAANRDGAIYEGAFGRRALIERAKGILMERHAVDEGHAFEMLRAHSRSTNRKLTTIAEAVVDGHRLLPRGPDLTEAT